MLGDGLPRTATPDGAEARREGRRLAGCVQPARLEETPEAVVDEAQAVRRVRRKLTEDNRRRRDEPGLDVETLGPRHVGRWSQGLMRMTGEPGEERRQRDPLRPSVEVVVSELTTATTRPERR